mgnify:CR=1 FL=1
MNEALNAALHAEYGGVHAMGGIHTMAGPGPGDVHVDAALSNLAVRYRPNEGLLLADMVCPVIPVAKRSDKYFTFNVANSIDLARADIAGQQGMPMQVSWGLSTDSYNVVDFGFRDFVPSDVMSNADAPLRPLADSTETLMDRLLLAREFRVATLVGATGSYGGNTVSLSGAQKWSNPASDPVADIETALATAGLNAMPNTMVLGKAAYDALRRHPALERYILSRSSTRMGAVGFRVDEQMIADAFGLDKVYVGKARYNSANPGATVTNTYIWGDVCALIRVEARPSANRTATFAYTFRFSPSGGSAIETRTWFDQAPGVRGGNWVKVTHSDTEKLVAGSNAGYLINDIT